MKKIGWLSGLFMLLCLVACPAEEEKQVNWDLESRYQRGNAAFARGDKSIAEREYRAVLIGDPRHVAAMCKLGRVLIDLAEAKEQGRKDRLLEAETLLKKAAKLEKENSVVLSDLAKARELLGDPIGAMQALEELLKTRPGQIETLLSLVNLEQANGRMQSAEKRLRAALPADLQGQAHLALARLLALDKRDEEGLKILATIPMCPPQTAAGKVHGPCPSAAYYEAQEILGIHAVKTGKLDEARKIYKNLVRVFPEDYMAWEVLAALDEREKKWVDAEKKYRKSLELDRVHMSVWRGLGRVLLAQAKGDEARFSLRKADGLLRDSPEQGIMLAKEILKFGEVDWARSVLERSKILLATDAKAIQEIEVALEKLEASPARPALDGGEDGESGK
ncbi:MAG: tetratricopeptide repeat protein [Deltaproteobacteria bacterium]|nr:tetratricopeptide repeat protein [Deltaproteobacteria bacterium]